MEQILGTRKKIYVFIISIYYMITFDHLHYVQMITYMIYVSHTMYYVYLFHLKISGIH